MRNRVEAAGRPDALYAIWEGQVFRAQRSTADGTVLLVVLQGEQAPEGFDQEWNGLPAKIVPGPEAGSTFAIHTHVRFDDDIYRVTPSVGDETVTLRWTGQDEARARDLGLTDFSIDVAPAALTALWQERHDFTEPSAVRDEPGTGDQNDLLRGIGRTLRRIVPTGWQRVGAQFRQVGDYAELEIRAVVAEGGADEETVSIPAPPQLSELFARLRTAMFEPGAGTWFQGTFTLTADANFDFDFDLAAEPDWRLPPGAHGRQGGRAYELELARFPRERAQVPGWLAARGGLPLDVTFQLPKIVDNHVEGEKPQVNRPPVAPEEIRPLLDYLFRAPVALARPGRVPDLLAPQGPPDVPDAFHTDGVWIWPVAVPHYLRKYKLPPDPELVDHIRANRFRLPYVSGRLRATAEAEVLGKPYPPQTERDLAVPDAVTKADRVAEPNPGLRASEVLTVLRRRLDEQGVLPSAYRIGEVADGAWCLRRTDDGWEVALHDGEPVAPVYFPRVESAARFLLGTLLLFPARARVGGPDEAQLREPPTDWPIAPLRGEPPLQFYRGKRMVTLPPGNVVQRFGNEAGNLLHLESASFAETSLAPEREHERRLYRVRRPLRVLTGVAVPWGGLPGGAVSYLLPRAVGHHVETGALERR